MQPTLCARCHKNMAVVFINRIENGQSHQEGLCLKCARELHIKPIDDIISKMGINDEDLDGLSSEMYYLFRGSNDNKYMVAKAGLQSKKPVVIKKYKKSKKLYVKKATKAYKVTSTGKLKIAKSLKKSAKVTVVGTSTVKKVKYYAIKSGKSTLLVKQSLLSKTKPKSAKPSSNRGNKPSKTKYNYTYNDKGQKVVTQDNGVPSNAANYAWDDFIRCKMPGVKPHHGDKCVGYKMVSGKKKNIYYNKADNHCYYIDVNGTEWIVMHKDAWGDGGIDADELDNLFKDLILN